jgi:archaellum component FlaF (FlaF/FlaG flagellin family)
MKKQILLFSTLAVMLGFSSCKKEQGADNSSEQIAIHAEDQTQYSSDIDGILNEVTAAIESNVSYSGRFQNQQDVICDATAVYNAASNPRTITITYSGSNCSGIRTRTGKVIISMAQGVQWKNPGASVTVTFQNVKITRIRDGRSFIINGAQTYTNVSGGLMINLPTLGTITHRIQSTGISLAFGIASARSWQVDKQRVFTYNNGLIVTTNGLHVEGDVSNVAEWGQNRFGVFFTTAITTPLVIRQDCSFRLTAGAVEHKTSMFNGTATFGLDATGSPTSCPGTDNYYFKMEWTAPGGTSYSRILPY